MPEPSETVTKLETHNGLPICWLCGEPVAEDEVVRLRVDDGLETLHPDCGERVAKSSH